MASSLNQTSRRISEAGTIGQYGVDGCVVVVAILGSKPLAKHIRSNIKPPQGFLEPIIPGCRGLESGISLTNLLLN